MPLPRAGLSVIVFIYTMDEVTLQNQPLVVIEGEDAEINANPTKSDHNTNSQTWEKLS